MFGLTRAFETSCLRLFELDVGLPRHALVVFRLERRGSDVVLGQPPRAVADVAEPHEAPGLQPQLREHLDVALLHGESRHF